MNDLIIRGETVPVIPDCVVEKPAGKIFPITRCLGIGRQLQVAIRLHGARLDKPHDDWYVLQITRQSHRGIGFVPQTNAWIHNGGRGKRVQLISYAASSGQGSPRIYSTPTNTVQDFVFCVQNTMGRLDDIPMIIDRDEKEAVIEAVLAYNEEFGNTGRNRMGSVETI